METKNNNKKIYKFNDGATNNIIIMEKNVNNVWINSHYIDPDNCKLFILLLKNAFDTIKESGCTKYQQLVLKDDWNNLLKNNKEWKIIKKNDETLLIECNIDIAAILITDGFLINNNI